MKINLRSGIFLVALFACCQSVFGMFFQSKDAFVADCLGHVKAAVSAKIDRFKDETPYACYDRALRDYSVMSESRSPELLRYPSIHRAIVFAYVARVTLCLAASRVYAAATSADIAWKSKNKVDAVIYMLFLVDSLKELKIANFAVQKTCQNIQIEASKVGMNLEVLSLVTPQICTIGMETDRARDRVIAPLAAIVQPILGGLPQESRAVIDSALGEPLSNWMVKLEV